MAWKDTTQNTQLREAYQFGEKPYGAYWVEVPDSQVPAPPIVPRKASLDDVVAALGKANIPIIVAAATATVDEVKPA